MLPLQLQPESHVPLYVQLRDQLRALVHTGDLRPGDRIPASRELATQLGVHRTTVANAYAELESEGLIQGHVGRGTFISAANGARKFAPPPPPAPEDGGSVRWESLFADERAENNLHRLTRVVPPDTISFVMARPDQKLFPLDEFRTCVNAVFTREGARILQMGPSDGYPPLREALLELFREEGAPAAPENLLITGGCQQSLDLLSKAFLRPGDAVVLEDPGYPGAISIFNDGRIRCLGVPVRSGLGENETPGLDVAALEATLSANRVKLIILTPDFHNPTGTTMPLESRRRLLEVAARHQAPVVEDHVYARLTGRAGEVPSLRQLDRSNLVIQIDSFSKVAFPGLRTGWILAPASVIERLRSVKQASDLHSDQLAQAALAEFTRRGLLVRHIARMRRVYAERLAVVQHSLQRHMPREARWTSPTGGMCVWIELPAGFDASELLIHVRERGVDFAPGRYFYCQNPQPNTLRLGFSGLEEPQIRRAIATLADVLKSEMRKRQRVSRRVEPGRVALV
ncbi:MAG: PLP-dependent aminotransferase family protein [Candidatus Acidiferrales bacterium]